MNKGLRGEFREEKENTRKILLHARMTEIRYNERFSLIFTQSVDGGWHEMAFSLMIDAPCWFGDRLEWESKVKEKAIDGYEDCCLTAELVRLRYWNLIDVQAVEFYDEYFQIVFRGDNRLAIAYDGESENIDYSWVLEELSDKQEDDKISIFCQGNQLFQNHISEYLALLERSDLYARYIINDIYANGYERTAVIEDLNRNFKFTVHFLEYDEYIENNGISQKRKVGHSIVGQVFIDLVSIEKKVDEGIMSKQTIPESSHIEAVVEVSEVIDNYSVYANSSIFNNRVLVAFEHEVEYSIGDRIYIEGSLEMEVLR